MNWSPKPRDAKVPKKKTYDNEKRSIKDLILQYHTGRPKTAGQEKFSLLPESFLLSKAKEVQEKANVQEKPIAEAEQVEEELSKRTQNSGRDFPGAAKEIGEGGEEPENSQPDDSQPQNSQPELSNRDEQEEQEVASIDQRAQRPSKIVTRQGSSECNKAPSVEEGPLAAELSQKLKSRDSEEPNSTASKHISNVMSGLLNKKKAKRKGGRKVTQKQEGDRTIDSATSLNSVKSKNSQRYLDPESATENVFKDLMLQSRNNKIEAYSSPTKQATPQSQPQSGSQHAGEDTEKVAVKTSSLRAKVQAVWQTQALANRQQAVKPSQFQIDEVAEADANFSMPQQATMSAVSKESTGGSNIDHNSQKAPDPLEVARKSLQYKPPVPKTFDKSRRYKLFDPDVPIEQALSYTDDSQINSQNNKISASLDEEYFKRLREENEGLAAETHNHQGGINQEAQSIQPQKEKSRPVESEKLLKPLSKHPKRRVRKPLRRGARAVSSSGAFQLSTQKALLLVEEESAEGDQVVCRLRAIPAVDQLVQTLVSQPDPFLVKEDLSARGDQQFNAASTSQTAGMVKPFHGEQSKLNPLGSQVLENASDLRSTNEPVIGGLLSQHEEESKAETAEKMAKQSTWIRPPQFHNTSNESLDIQRPTLIEIKPLPQDSKEDHSRAMSPNPDEAEDFDSLAEVNKEDVNTEERPSMPHDHANNDYDEPPFEGFNHSPASVKVSISHRNLTNVHEPIAESNELAEEEKIASLNGLPTIHESPENELEYNQSNDKSGELRKGQIIEAKPDILRKTKAEQQPVVIEMQEQQTGNDLMRRSLVRKPQEGNEGIPGEAHTEYIREMVQLEQMIRGQVRSQVQDVMGNKNTLSRYTGRDTHTSDRTNTAQQGRAEQNLQQRQYYTQPQQNILPTDIMLSDRQSAANQTQPRLNEQSELLGHFQEPATETNVERFSSAYTMSSVHQQLPTENYQIEPLTSEEERQVGQEVMHRNSVSKTSPRANMDKIGYTSARSGGVVNVRSALAHGAKTATFRSFQDSLVGSNPSPKRDDEPVAADNTSPNPVLHTRNKLASRQGVSNPIQPLNSAGHSSIQEGSRKASDSNWLSPKTQNLDLFKGLASASKPQFPKSEQSGASQQAFEDLQDLQDLDDIPTQPLSHKPHPADQRLQQSELPTSPRISHQDPIQDRPHQNRDPTPRQPQLQQVQSKVAKAPKEQLERGKKKQSFSTNCPRQDESKPTSGESIWDRALSAMDAEDYDSCYSILLESGSTNLGMVELTLL